jgi:hypothetical protein
VFRDSSRDSETLRGVLSWVEIWGLGFGVWGLGLGFGVWSLGFRVWGSLPCVVLVAMLYQPPVPPATNLQIWPERVVMYYLHIWPERVLMYYALWFRV